MPFHFQALPSSHLPSMADHHMLPGHLPISYLRTATNYIVPPPQPNLPSFTQPSSKNKVKSTSRPLSQRYLTPPTAACPSGPSMQAPPLPAPLAGLRAGGIPNTSTFTIAGHTLRHGSDPVVGYVEFDELWIESHLAQLEVIVQQDSGEQKGRVYLGIWLGLREAKLRERQSVLYFVAQTLMPYPWYGGNETFKEALRALERLEFINAGLLAKKYMENANWFWNKMIGNVRVRDYWVAEATRLQQKVQAQARAQH